MTFRIRLTTVVPRLVIILLGASNHPIALAQSVDIAAGEKLWEFCAFCHNADGLGQEPAPMRRKLAGDPAWYTERTTDINFRTRGSRLAPRGPAWNADGCLQRIRLIDEAAIRNMAAYIESMPVTPENPGARIECANRPRRVAPTSGTRNSRSSDTGQ